MAPATDGQDICSYLHLDGIAVRSNLDIANMIHTALHELMQDYSPPACLPPFSNNTEDLTISPSEVFKVLLDLNPRKAGGPDGINNWLLREYAGFLTSPVCDILNSSFAEQKLPRSWRDADVSLLMKVKPVIIITKHIRPISLSSALSKLAEEFVVSKYIGPAVLELIDPYQFGAIPKSSTLQLSFQWCTLGRKPPTGQVLRCVLCSWITGRHLTL